VNHRRRTLRGEGYSAGGWGIVGSVWLQTAGFKVRSFGQSAAATCAAPSVSLPVSTPLRIVNRCWPGFPCKWRYINVAPFATFATFNKLRMGYIQNEQHRPTQIYLRPLAPLNLRRTLKWLNYLFNFSLHSWQRSPMSVKHTGWSTPP